MVAKAQMPRTTRVRERFCERQRRREEEVSRDNQFEREGMGGGEGGQGYGDLRCELRPDLLRMSRPSAAPGDPVTVR